VVGGVVFGKSTILRLEGDIIKYMATSSLPVDGGLVGLLLGFVVFLVLLLKSVILVRPFQKGIVEKFGKYDRTIGAGISFILPFVENVYKVDMREAVIDVPAQEVITSDNVNIGIDAVVYFKVIDPFKIMYNVAMFEEAVSKLAQTNIRNMIGGMKLDDTLASRDNINLQLRKVLGEITERWGVSVTRVEIQNITPPQDIVDAMSRQMKAERTRRAAILEAEGFKNAEVLKAEGKKTAEILDAEGKAKAIETIAEAERKKRSLIAEGDASAISQVFSAMHMGRPTKDILTLKYLETLGKMAEGQATKIFMPFETGGVLSGAAVLGEIFRGGGESKKLGPEGRGESSLESAGNSDASVKKEKKKE